MNNNEINDSLDQISKLTSKLAEKINSSTKVVFDRKELVNNIINKFSTAILRCDRSEYEIANYLLARIEIEDCGSIGGFDKNNPLAMEFKSKLANRILTVYRKHGVIEEEELKDLKSRLYLISVFDARILESIVENHYNNLSKR